MDTTRSSGSKDQTMSFPRSFTQTKIDLVLKDIKRGSPIKYAAEANGIAESTFHTAIKQGITDIRCDEPESIYARLVVSLRQIELEDVIGCLDDVRKDTRGHKGAEWVLEHKYWRQFCGDAKLMELSKEVDQLKQEANKDEKQ